MPAKHGFEDAPTMLVATDLTGRAELAVKRAAALAGATGARLDIVHVMDDITEHLRGPFETMLRDALGKQIDAAAAGSKIDAEVRVIVGGADVNITELARTSQADLVICGAHRPRPGREKWLGSTMDRVLKHGDRPVLVVKTPSQGPYRKIVVGVDFSDCSARALDFAMRLLPGSELLVVHTFHVPYAGVAKPAGLAGAVAKGARLEEAEQLDAWLKPFSAMADKLAIRLIPVIERGDAQVRLMEAVTRQAADLLVIGTHGRTGLRHAILGSVAEHIVAHAPTDVLVVR
jgi:nucleotide-binding universal stress UspA family protein